MNSNQTSNDKSTKKKQKKPKKIGYWFYDLAKVTAAIPAMLWERTKMIHISGNTHGKRKKLKGAVLISSNHISMMDPFILLTAFWERRLEFMATVDLYANKLAKFTFEHFHCIPVDRDNFSMATFHTVIDRLRKQKVVVIFPEGKVNEENEKGMLALKSGIVLMAVSAKAPVLPIYIVERKKWYKRQVILVGDEIDVISLCGERPTSDGIKAACEYIREREMELWNHYCENIVKKKKKNKK